MRDQGDHEVLLSLDLAIHDILTLTRSQSKTHEFYRIGCQSNPETRIVVKGWMDLRLVVPGCNGMEDPSPFGTFKLDIYIANASELVIQG